MFIFTVVSVDWMPVMACTNLGTACAHSTWSEIVWPANQNQEKSPQAFAHLVNFSKNVSAMFYNQKILLFWLYNHRQSFAMFLLLDLCFMFCSRDVNVLRAQRIIGFFHLTTHRSPRSENPNTWPSWRLTFWTSWNRTKKRFSNVNCLYLHPAAQLF